MDTVSSTRWWATTHLELAVQVHHPMTERVAFGSDGPGWEYNADGGIKRGEGAEARMPMEASKEASEWKPG